MKKEVNEVIIEGCTKGTTLIFRPPICSMYTRCKLPSRVDTIKQLVLLLHLTGSLIYRMV